MAFMYFITAATIFRIIYLVVKALFVLLVAYLIFKTLSRLIIKGFYNKIKRISIHNKKNIIKKESVPTGYGEGYFRTEHYKYLYSKEGTKYWTRVYFSKRFFIPYIFKDNDELFLQLIKDAGISLNNL